MLCQCTAGIRRALQCFPWGRDIRGHPCVWGWAPIHPRPGVGFGQKLINKFICTTAHSGKVFFFLCNSRIQNRRKESSDLDIRSQKDGGPWGHVDRVPYINRLSAGDFIPSVDSGGGLRPSNCTCLSVPPLAPSTPSRSKCLYISAIKITKTCSITI